MPPLSLFAGGCSDLNIFHHSVHHSINPQYNPGYFQRGREWEPSGQPSLSHGRGCLHYLVHSRVHLEVCHIAREVEIPKECYEYHRHSRHYAILFVTVPD